MDGRTWGACVNGGSTGGGSARNGAVTSTFPPAVATSCRGPATSSGKMSIAAVKRPAESDVTVTVPRPGFQVSVIAVAAGNPVPCTCVTWPGTSTGGDRLSAGAVTAAVAATGKVAGGSPSSVVVTTRLPVKRPGRTGVKVTVAVQPAPECSTSPRHVWAPSVKDPVVRMPVTVAGPGPALVNLIVTV